MKATEARKNISSSCLRFRLKTRQLDCSKPRTKETIIIIIVVVVGALGTTPKKLKQRLSDKGIEKSIVELQKTTISYSARIPRNALEA